jgi:pimeloyl-ACP methyl ester carboxylesterase
MQALFVHGMGRSPISAIPLLWRLKRKSISPSWFFYSVTFEDFSAISQRLQKKILAIAAKGDYVLIGHSLGGVLIRDAVASLPSGTKMPDRIFLLGSPIHASRIATALRRNVLYRLATRDCGQLLASEERMKLVPPSPIPTTSIVGTRTIVGLSSLFGDEINDGIVSHSEVTADWISEELQVPAIHGALSWSRQVSQLVIERLSVSSH